MIKLSEQYKWLNDLGVLPLLVQKGLQELGTKEISGPTNSQVIMDWADETELKTSYTADAVPWCGLFMAVIAKRAGKQVPKHPLWALNWAMFGNKGYQPCLGDVLVYKRKGGGHVGIYIAEDQTAYHTLGGNQSDQVSIERIEKTRLFAVRRPKVDFAHVASAKPYIVERLGKLSRNEA